MGGVRMVPGWGLVGVGGSAATAGLLPIQRSLCQPPCDRRRPPVATHNPQRRFRGESMHAMRPTASTGVVALLGVLGVLAVLAVLAVGVAAETEEACETLPSEIHIVKEEFDELGRLSRTCNGDITVNKCEGACTSQVQPSVITPTGFLKECYCCRESFLRERQVSLTHCYDPDGARLTDEGRHSMEVKLREPADCRCSKCGDYTR